MLVKYRGHFRRVHTYTRTGDHITNECHAVFVEFTFFDLGVELVVPENLQDVANMADVKSWIGGVDDDVVEDAHRRHIKVLP